MQILAFFRWQKNYENQQRYYSAQMSIIRKLTKKLGLPKRDNPVYSPCAVRSTQNLMINFLFVKAL